METRKELAKTILKQIKEKADLAGIYYVACLWIAPALSNQMSERHIFFEESAEGEAWMKQQVELYTRYGFPFYIDSDNYFCTHDGGLFDETTT